MSLRTVHVFAALFVTALLALVAMSPAHASGWAEEDGPIETLGAVWLVVAAFCLLYQFFLGVEREGARALVRNAWLPLLALLFIFIAGEEISWGQRIFDFDTPAALAGNRQGESNIHNLEIFHGVTAEGERKTGSLASLFVMDRLFTMFWLSWCLLLPLAWRRPALARRLLTRLRLPMPTVAFGLLFVAVYLATKTLDVTVAALDSHTLVETKEAALESLLGMVGVWLWLLTPREIALARDVAPAPERAPDTVGASPLLRPMRWRRG